MTCCCQPSNGWVDVGQDATPARAAAAGRLRAGGDQLGAQLVERSQTPLTVSSWVVTISAWIRRPDSPRSAAAHSSGLGVSSKVPGSTRWNSSSTRRSSAGGDGSLEHGGPTGSVLLACDVHARSSARRGVGLDAAGCPARGVGWGSAARCTVLAQGLPPHPVPPVVRSRPVRVRRTRRSPSPGSSRRPSRMSGGPSLVSTASNEPKPVTVSASTTWVDGLMLARPTKVPLRALRRRHARTAGLPASSTVHSPPPRSTGSVRRASPEPLHRREHPALQRAWGPTGGRRPPSPSGGGASSGCPGRAADRRGSRRRCAAPARRPCTAAGSRRRRR